MQLGVIFPQLEIGADPGGVRAFAEAAEGLGYEHLIAFDHVIGADPARPDGTPWTGPYTHQSLFHEPFVLFSHLAAITSRIEFVTGILILPQRQTVLVAKQAAELDVLSQGRLRLGVGTGWNEVEYEALNENFHNRGRRQEEQVALLRALWADPVVNFEGRWHHVTKAGINPLPTRRSIPVWFGGTADAVLDRIGRMGDGWFSQRVAPETLHEPMGKIRAAAERAGRDPDAIGVQAQVMMRGEVQRSLDQAAAWIDAGVTHLAVNTMGGGYSVPAQHIEAIERFKQAWNESMGAKSTS